jgi:hypothetical protein
MKIYLSKALFIWLIISSCNDDTNKLTPPNWILGGWSNTFQNDASKLEIWTFSKDKIKVNKILMANILEENDFLKQYEGFSILQEIKEKEYKVIFTKKNEIVIYDFLLQKVEYVDKTVMTYSLMINGVLKYSHSTSSNLIFTR